MTTINNIEDLARILETQPHWAATMRTLLLGQEILALPETVARLAATVEELRATVEALQETVARLTDAVQELQQGQAGLQQGQAGLQQGQAGLQQGQAGLQQGQAGLQQDVNELKDGQAELRQDVDELKAGQAELRRDVDELKAGQARIETSIGYLLGSDLEARLHRRIRPLLSQHLRLRQSRVMQSTLLEANDDFFNEVTEALASGLITPDQEQRVSDTDFIVRARRGSPPAPVWVAVEAANRLDEGDVTRVRDTADALAAIYGEEAIPVVIGYQIDEPDRERAAAVGVRVITIRPVLPL